MSKKCLFDYVFEAIVTPLYPFLCAEVNISDASVDALYFGSAILIDIIVI